MKSFLIWVFCFISAVTALAWVSKYKILKFVAREMHNKESEKVIPRPYMEQFLIDRKKLSEIEFFKPSKGTQDAASYLNPRVSWELPWNMKKLPKAALALPDELLEEMSAKNWHEKSPDFEKLNLDFSWMSELHKFDYWSLEIDSPAYPEGKKYHVYESPSPNLLEILTWAKLRLLHGKEMGDLLGALKDVRQLARLVWTHDYVDSILWARNLLSLESNFPMDEWRPIPKEVRSIMKRYFRAQDVLLSLNHDDHFLNSMTNTELGLCSLVNEGLKHLLFFKEMLQHEMKEKYQKADSLLKHAASKCRRSVIHQIWDDPIWSLYEDRTLVGGWIVIEDKAKLYVPKLTWKEAKKEKDLMVGLGYFYLMSLRQDYFSQYL